MKSLIIFYSRTKTTKKVAQVIFKKIGGDIEEIIDSKNRKGPVGYFLSGRDATLKNVTSIKKIKKNPSKYDVIIIGTPIWAFTMSTPIRTYIHQNKGKFNNVAFFCTMGSSGSKKTFKAMEKLIGKKPIALLDVKTLKVIKGNYIDKVDKFVKKIMKFKN